jgi:diguanylate cyclase (GGDEF)-like protein
MLVAPRFRRPASPAIVMLVTVVLAGQVLAAIDGGLRGYVFGLSVLLLDGLGAGLSLRAGRRSRNSGWYLIAAGRLVSLISTVTLTVAVTMAHNSGVWWWVGTLTRLAMFAFLSLGVMIGPARELAGRRRRAFLAEAFTVLGCGFMVVWYFVIDPSIDGHPATFRWVATIGFPIGDLLLLMAVAMVVLAGGLQRLSHPLTVFVGGLTCFLVGDASYTAMSLHGDPNIVSPFGSTALVIASMMLTVAPMLMRAGTPGDRHGWHERVSPAWSSHLPVAALGVGCAMLVVVTVDEHELVPWGGLVFGLIVMTGAVAVRQLISLRDSRDLIVSDALTGLANRTGLDNAVNLAVRQHEQMALLLIDLDGFKLINDGYGHAAGDTVLVEFAHLLRSTVRTDDVAARIGGDEFVVLLTDVATPEQATIAADRILAAAAASPVRLGDDTVPIRASIGIAPGRAQDSTKELIRRADVAMYQSKRIGAHGWTMHDQSMTDRRVEDAALSDDLEGAVDRGEMYVLYQPLVDLTTGHPIAVEALVRWQHPTRGLVPPVRFIPIAERSGAITGIGLFVLEQACAQLAAWRSRVPADQRMHVSVNLSPRQLQEPSLVRDVLGVLERTGLASEHLVLEVTETAIVDEKTGIAALRTLRSHGIRIAIDDFGTGYSSLHYLTRLPVDILKIDRSFVAELNGTPEGSAITEAVIRLSQVLHLGTVAEGIETTAQAEELLALGCDTGQGYLYAKPMPPADLDDRMTATRVRAA